MAKHCWCGVQCWPSKAPWWPPSLILLVPAPWLGLIRNASFFNLSCQWFLPARSCLDSPPWLWHTKLIRLLSDFSYIFLFSCIVSSSVLLSAAVEAAPLLPVKPPQPFWRTKQPSGCVGPWGAQWHWDVWLTVWCPAHAWGWGGVMPRQHHDWHSRQRLSPGPTPGTQNELISIKAKEKFGVISKCEKLL